jgi:eukaryotic-like serine/threonine-protein kinase
MLDPRASRFWQAVIRSGLVDAEKLTACWEAIEPAKRDQAEQIDRRLAWQAVESRCLTLWQAQQLMAGRTKGYRVDRYLLLDVIGQGGMGRVYMARDARLDRLVALKILPPDRLRSPEAFARFQREARMGAQLQHENLVRIYDYGESEGRHFLVMEYIEGKTIAASIEERGAMPPATAVRLIRQVAMGLEHLHRKGLVHRDVNPHNILVTEDGIAKLADMGLAIAVADDDRVTHAGATVGTFDYVAPEQARNSRAADARSDIYSLGCTLYHMCSGQVPFPGPTLPEKLLAHQVSEPAPLARVVPGLPEGLDAIVRRMMRKSPAERYATPMEVALALGPYQGQHAGDRDREGVPPAYLSPGIAAMPRSDDGSYRRESGHAAALVAAAAAPAGLGPFTMGEVNRGPGPYADDPAAPLLTPDDGFEEVRLIPDHDPEPSSGVGPRYPGPQSATGDPEPAGAAAGPAGWLSPIWLWGFVALTVAVAVLILILAIV